MAVFPLTDLPGLTLGPHLLAHYAFATRELVSRLGVDSYVARNEEITDLVAAYVGKSRPRGVLALSSGAVYLGDEMEANPYGVLKARAERRFLEMTSAMVEETVLPRLVIPRLFNLSGPFLNKPDHYVLGSIIRDIKQGGPIRLSASRPVVRSYVHVRDLVELAFAVMLGDDPPPPSVFDTAGEREIEVGELARLAASVLGAPEMEIVRPPLDEQRPDRYVGDPSVLNALASRYGLAMTTLPQQIVDTALALEM
jgi:nucleoside-diphosphate-sugar epimerase